MLTNFSVALQRYAHWYFVLPALALSAFFSLVLMPGYAALVPGGKLIDLLWFYHPAQAYALIESYGPAARAAYRFSALTVDVLYPLIYSCSLALLLSWLYGRRWQHFNLLPFLAAIFDLGENLCIAAMLSIYPASPAGLAWISTLFTFSKWVTLTGVALLIVLGLGLKLLGCARITAA